ncbi:MetS family NSS transporter small subunit [Rubrobacter aplysinae]|nr:MetS family NSS transporter small subunit [Rubrobacter aplysinae]
MGFGAVIMLLIGAIGLWGGFALAVAHFLRSSNRERNGRVS